MDNISRAVYRGICVQTNTWVMGVPIFPKKEPNICHLISNECETVVHAASVGQFTGLRDKNAVPIYEGDIVDWFDYGKHHIGVIEYMPEEARYKISWRKIHGIGWNDLIYVRKKQIEVIGNIYEHPHLLK